MADIIVRDLGLGLYEAVLVSEAVSAHIRERNGSEPATTALLDNNELWLMSAAAEAAGFTVEFEDEIVNFDVDDLGIQYDL